MNGIHLSFKKVSKHELDQARQAGTRQATRSPDMVQKSTSTVKSMFNSARSRIGQTVKLGYVPLSDCAPLVMAHELGLFKKHGLAVELSRELGWASIREKMAYGELDGSHALCALPFVLSLGLDSAQCDCVATLILNRHGNAITVSRGLAPDPPCDARRIFEVIRSRSKHQPVVLAVVSRYSSHYFLLRQWLKSGGLDPRRDVRLVILPPSQMATHLAQGIIDGFCVGEPWNSEAVRKRAGVCVALSVDLAPMHPEKVFMVRKRFVEEDRQRVEAITLALLEACRFCSLKKNHAEIAAVLSGRDYVGIPSSVLLRSFDGYIELSRGDWVSREDFEIFYGGDLNAPNYEAGKRVYLWFLEALGSPTGLPRPEDLVPRIYRNDLFEGVRDRFSEGRLVTANPSEPVCA